MNLAADRPADPRKFVVIVTQRVEITLDATKFDEPFMEAFRQVFFPLFSLEDHACFLAQLQARGVYEIDDRTFIEGYGPAQDMGIKAAVLDCDEEVEESGA